MMQIASLLSALVNWKLASIRGIGWGWTGVIWLYNIVIYMLLDPIKFAVRYGLSGRAWNLVTDNKVSRSVEGQDDGWIHAMMNRARVLTL